MVNSHYISLVYGFSLYRTLPAVTTVIDRLMSDFTVGIALFSSSVFPILEVLVFVLCNLIIIEYVILILVHVFHYFVLVEGMLTIGN